MRLAECEIENLVFGFTETGQIILPAEFTSLDPVQQQTLMKYAVQIAPHLKYHASMVNSSYVEIMLDIFSRGKAWRHDFITTQIKNFVSSPRTVSRAATIELAAAIEYLVKCQWMCDQDSSQAEHPDFNADWGFVYILKASPFNCYKIGFTTDPKTRLKNFGVKLPFPVECIHLVSVMHPRKLETELHIKYADKRLDGEWFNLTPEDIQEICIIEPYFSEWTYVLACLQNEPTPTNKNTTGGAE